MNATPVHATHHGAFAPWLRQVSEQAPKWVAAALVAAIVADAALWVTHQRAYLASARSPGEVTSAPGATAMAGSEVPALLARLVGAHLFGVAPPVGAAPQTDLPLVLAGVIARPDPARGMAIIGQSAQATQLYTAGSLLMNGARLQSVFSDRVLLERGGVIETLLLPRSWRGGPADGAKDEDSIAQAGDPQQALRAIPEQAPAFDGALRSQPVVSDEGRLDGLRLVPGHGGIMALADLGLEPSDVVKAVNGRGIDTPADATGAMETLAEAKRATVLIVRGGHERELTLDLSKIDADHR
jgi:general secretion pathway protein C